MENIYLSLGTVSRVDPCLPMHRHGTHGILISQLCVPFYAFLTHGKMIFAIYVPQLWRDIFWYRLAICMMMQFSHRVLSGATVQMTIPRQRARSLEIPTAQGLLQLLSHAPLAYAPLENIGHLRVV